MHNAEENWLIDFSFNDVILLCSDTVYCEAYLINVELCSSALLVRLLHSTPVTQGQEAVSTARAKLPIFRTRQGRENLD